MNEIDSLKNQLRRRLKAERAALGDDERAAIDKAIAERVLELPEFRDAAAIAGYASFGAEVSTWELLRAALEAGKTVLLPRCETRGRMTWHRFDDEADLVKSPMGMLEPSADAPDFDAFDEHSLALAPGLCFDRHGFRLGYGGGYYDRFLPEFPGVSVGLCRSMHHRDELGCRGPHDAAVDVVVTDAGVYRRV